MSPLISVQWVGHRKDGSSRGSIWGWFVMAGQPFHAIPAWAVDINNPPLCYVLRGRIGKTLHIEEHHLTTSFLEDARSKYKNYKEQDPIRLKSRWGSIFDEDLSMFLLTVKLRG